jgi:hypothetical protein
MRAMAYTTHVQPVRWLHGTWSTRMLVASLSTLADSRVLYETVPVPEYNITNCYGFRWRLPSARTAHVCSEFACSLNEPTPLDEHLPLSDTRRRPDICLIESGNFKRASEIKNALEHRQRKRRIEEHKSNAVDHCPRWFTPTYPSDEIVLQVRSFLIERCVATNSCAIQRREDKKSKPIMFGWMRTSPQTDGHKTKEHKLKLKVMIN